MATLLERHAEIFLSAVTLVIALACLAPFDFFHGNTVTVGRAGGIRFSVASVAYHTETGPILSRSGEFTIVLKFRPSFSPFNLRKAQIAGSGLDDKRGNFSFVQMRKDLMFCSGSDGKFAPDRCLRIRNLFLSDSAVEVVVRSNGEQMNIVAGGRTRDSLVLSGPSSWYSEYPMVLGNDAGLERPWSGTIDTLAIFPVYLEDSVLDSSWWHRNRSDAAVFYESVDSTGTMIPDRGRSGVDCTIPKYYRPPSPKYLASGESLRPLDILVNIGGFVPFGFFLGLVLLGRHFRFMTGLITVVIMSVLFSTCCELLQVYLPSRTSDLADVLSNGLGGFVGDLLCLRVYRMKVIS